KKGDRQLRLGRTRGDALAAKPGHHLWVVRGEPITLTVPKRIASHPEHLSYAYVRVCCQSAEISLVKSVSGNCVALSELHDEPCKRIAGYPSRSPCLGY